MRMNKAAKREAVKRREEEEEHEGKKEDKTADERRTRLGQARTALQPWRIALKVC